MFALSPRTVHSETCSCGSVRVVDRTVLALQLQDLAAGRPVRTFPEDVSSAVVCALCGDVRGLVA